MAEHAGRFAAEDVDVELAERASPAAAHLQSARSAEADRQDSDNDALLDGKQKHHEELGTIYEYNLPRPQRWPLVGASRERICTVVALALLAVLVLALAAATGLLAADRQRLQRLYRDSVAASPAASASAGAPPPASNGTLAKFLVVGDWGRRGLQNQSAVAAAMARRAAELLPDFIISVGDNFYDSGLTSPEDPAFDATFTSVYSHPSLQVPWHAVLGNHDYGEYWSGSGSVACEAGSAQQCDLSPLHQLSPRLAQRDWRWHCERQFRLSLAGGRIDLFFIDTNPAIEAYYNAPWANNKGGLREQSWEAQRLELAARLAASRAPWRLVVGHHPVRNNHLPFNTPELEAGLEPLLQAGGVRAYFSGHEHNLQHLHVAGAAPHYLVSGGGSKTDYFPPVHYDNGGSRWQWQGSGFLAVEVREEALDAEFRGLQDELLYRLTIPRQPTSDL